MCLLRSTNEFDSSTKSQFFIDSKKNVNKYFYSIVKIKLTVVS